LSWWVWYRSLCGRVVIVTGASSGIGREIALLCAQHGARVLVMDIQATPLEGGRSTCDEWAYLQQQQLQQQKTIYLKVDDHRNQREQEIAQTERRSRHEPLSLVDEGCAFANYSGDVVYMRGDTTSAADCQAAITEAVRRWGRVDVWVNNAAIGMGGNCKIKYALCWILTATITKCATIPPFIHFLV